MKTNCLIPKRYVVAASLLLTGVLLACYDVGVSRIWVSFVCVCIANIRRVTAAFSNQTAAPSNGEYIVVDDESVLQPRKRPLLIIDIRHDSHCLGDERFPCVGRRSRKVLFST